MTQWHNLKAMLSDIQSYVKETGATIVSEDDYLRRVIRFVAKHEAQFTDNLKLVASIMEESEETWEIPVSTIRNMSSGQFPGAVKTAAGRQFLARFLSAK